MFSVARLLVLSSLVFATGFPLTAPAATSSAPSTVPGVPVAPVPPETKTLLLQMEDAFTGIAKNSEPWVVNVQVLKLPSDTNSNGSTDMPGDDQPNAATGSGLIVSSDGYVLTNDHVVNGATDVTVTLADGREFPGTVAEDYASDLAVIKINPDTALPVAPFGDSDAVLPGQWAIAIGSPFDLQNTMTVGVISAINRHQAISEGNNERYYPDLIQTDAAINPGNSGGPLLNIDGQVVGINVAIESPVEGSSGVGFAIPSRYAESIMNELIADKHVTRGYLGVEPADLTPALRSEFGVDSGAWVKTVVQDSPAGKSGIRAADIITNFDGKPVTGELSLREAITTTAPGTAVPVTLVRNMTPVNITVTIAPPPERSEDVMHPSVAAPRKLGVSVRTLTASDRQESGFGTSLQGAYITSVVTNSPADLAGLAEGDVITQVDRQTITSADDFAKTLAALSAGLPTTIVIERSSGGQIKEMALDIQP